MSPSYEAGRKRELRIRALRHEAPPGGEAGSRAIGHLLGLLELASARVWAVYAELPGEVPTAQLRQRLRERRMRVVLPRVQRDALVLHVVESDRALRSGYHRVPEPSAHLPVVAVESVDAFVVPGLLFDRRGFRLGRGGGYYDRLLARSREDAVRVGLCYADRVVEELPVDPWDVPMDIIVTERGAIRPLGPGSEKPR